VRDRSRRRQGIWLPRDTITFRRRISDLTRAVGLQASPAALICKSLPCRAVRGSCVTRAGSYFCLAANLRPCPGGSMAKQLNQRL